ncbi:MAG TPA: hypothetical protein VF042_01850 [Gemmatimonadaceae bacterium]
MTDDAEPVVIRRCEICGEERILESKPPSADEQARCACGITPLNALDLEALSDRGP